MQSEGRARIPVGAQVRAYLRKNASKRRRYLTPLPLYHTPNTNNKCPNTNATYIVSQFLIQPRRVASRYLIQPRPAGIERERVCPRKTRFAPTQVVWSCDHRICVAMFFYTVSRLNGENKKSAPKKTKMVTVTPPLGGNRDSLSLRLFVSLYPHLPPSLSPSRSLHILVNGKKKYFVNRRAGLGFKRIMGGLYDTQDSALATEETRRAHLVALQSISHPSRFLL